MNELVVRRLLVDLQPAPALHWLGGDAFRTAFFNALSMSFPAGEQFFIDAMKMGLGALPEHERAAWDAEARGFIGQEATHRRLHALFNAHLQQQGLVNHWERRILRRAQALAGKDARAWLAVTAATEHFTAILAEWLLARPGQFDGTEHRLATLWLWHASEESEHRASAFDLYRALGGNELWRLRMFRWVTWFFCTDALRQTLHNLWRDGSWKRGATWAQGWRFLFGRDGLVRAMAAPWRRYLASDFHPSQQDDAPARRWLAVHADQWRAVGAAATASVPGAAAS